ncbi:uncharacterized protein LOC111076370 [Drosophila obscura]|uniref:uncharacterized protein LOC111076370 n=1 Tax=Drosophila obscura TaxID=7282 RepID=UPI001BB1FCFF|nr:uncharacterized protein LOC111076370 [Drosophila obscura]XP_022225822.2 uncharacterized protein LOC111076370 [Drosophila obscura]
MQQDEGPSGSGACGNYRQNTDNETRSAAVIEENTQTLQQLVQLLSMKISADEIDKKNDARLVVENFAKIIPEFSGENMSVQQWFNNFELNAEAYGLNDKQKYVQARAKMTCTAALFLESIAVYEYGQLRQELIQEFKSDRLCSAEIHNQLSVRVKTNNESFHEYILQMKRIASHGTTDPESVIRYIVDGLKLKTDYKYTLYGCTSYKQLKEKYEIYERTLSADEGLMLKKKDAQPFEKRQNHNNYMRKQHCYNCGSQDHLRRDCRAALKCFRCNQTGHMSKVCPSAAAVNVVYEEKRLKSLKINNVQVKGLIDTGADVSILKMSVFGKMSGVILQPSSSTLRRLGNNITRSAGQFMAEVEIDGMCLAHKFLVVADNAVGCELLLGHDFISRFTMMSTPGGYQFSPLSGEETVDTKQISIYNVVEAKTDIDVPSQYRDAVQSMIQEFNEKKQTAVCPIMLKIVPDENIAPFRHAPSRVAISEADVVKQQVDEWANEPIRRSSSNFASRTVIVKKKDGSNRVCVDYRQLNKMVLKDCFPVPIVEDVLEKLENAKMFTIMDLENGFFHVPVEEGSKKYTAFITKQGLYEFNRAPFGFCNSPAVFIRFIGYVFQNLINENILDLYTDDIVIHAETADE